MRSLILLGMALLVITLAVYWQAGDHEFLNLDDNVYVTENFHVTTGITGSNIVWAFTSTEAANWHPITWLSHMADVQFYGMNPRGHHLTNLIIHAVSTVLLLCLLFRLTGALWKSAFVAALFALHPLHVESVAWVAERKDLLCGFFWFLTLLLYAEFTIKRKTNLYMLSLFSFVLGLMSKPMLVTLPVVMLLMDFWPLERFRQSGRKLLPDQLSGTVLGLIKEKIPFFIFSLLSAAVTIYAQQKGGAIQNLEATPFKLRIENALVSYVKYIVKALWPHDLAVLYPFPLSIPLWQVISSLIFLFIISIAATLAWRRYPYLLFGWLWFIVTLIPVIGLIKVGTQSMADRYSYIPLIGLFIMAAWGVSDLTKWLQHWRDILALLSTVAIISSAVLTGRQLTYWRDNTSLYRHAIQVTADNFLIHYNLGLQLASKGELDEAIQEYNRALLVSPKNTNIHNNLGMAFVYKGEVNAGIQEFQRALQIDWNNVEAYNNLGSALALKGDLHAAIQKFQVALQIDPNNAGAHFNMGRALDNIGNLDAAIQEYQKVLQISPDNENANNNLRLALTKKMLLDRK